MKCAFFLYCFVNFGKPYGLCNLQINTVIFDKTGTVTYGVPHVEKIVLLGKDQSLTARHKLLAIIGSAESCSEHPIAAAIVSHAKKVNNLLI